MTARQGISLCVALSVDVDRFSDAVLRKRWIRGLTINGAPATVASLREACAAARAKGWEVFPPCDHVDARGVCKGHPIGAEGGR